VILACLLGAVLSSSLVYAATITSVSPISGSTAGGNTLTVNGSGFQKTSLSFSGDGPYNMVFSNPSASFFEVFDGDSCVPYDYGLRVELMSGTSVVATQSNNDYWDAYCNNSSAVLWTLNFNTGTSGINVIDAIRVTGIISGVESSVTFTLSESINIKASTTASVSLDVRTLGGSGPDYANAISVSWISTRDNFTYIPADLAPTVTVGGLACTNVTVLSDTQLTCTVPANDVAGPVDVSVTTPTGTVTQTGGYTYIAPTLSITGVSNVDLGKVLPGNFVSANTSLTVNSDYPDGYTLQISSNTSSTDMVNGGYSIPALTEPNFGTSSAWGYSLDNSTWQGVPPLGSALPLGLIDSPTSAYPSNTHDYTIYYGLQAGATQASGKYQTTVLYTAISK
jgi:hypothetical protein